MDIVHGAFRALIQQTPDQADFNRLPQIAAA
jgi:hypothetical protein